MKLLTKEISEKAQRQYPMGSSMDQMVVAKFFDPCGSWTWYLMNMSIDEDYCWGIVSGFEIEMGFFSLDLLQSVKGPLGVGIERDKFFKPMPAKELWEKLQAGKHV